MNTLTLSSLLIASALLPLSLSGCGSDEDRQAKYYNKAHALFQNSAFDKAELEVKNVLQINPNHAEGRYLLAQIYEEDQNWREMFGNLQMAVDANPELIDARLKLGQLHYLGSSYALAMEQAEEVLTRQADNADAHTLRGSVLFRQGDNQGALEEAQLALIQEPGHIAATSVIFEIYKSTDPGRALAAIGEGIRLQNKNSTLRLLKIGVLEEQQDWDGVVKEYQQLIADYPENHFFHYKLIKVYEDNERIDEAEELLRDLVKTNPDNLQLKLWLTEFIATQRNLSMAERTLKQFIDNQPEAYELRTALGKIHIALLQYPEAQKVYSEVISLDPEGVDSQHARNQLVKIYLIQGQQAEAQKLLDEIFEIEPANSEALIITARLDMVNGNAGEAIPKLRTVVKNQPDSVEALVMLARAHEDTGAQDLALDNYRNALAIAPNNEQAALNTAKLLLARENNAGADQLLASFLKNNPNNIAASQMLAESYSKQGKFDKALAVATELTESETNEAIGLYLQGRIQFANKEYAQAETALEQLLAMKPGAAEALTFLVNAYRGQGKQDEAYQYLTQHIKNYPELAYTHELLGTFENSRGNLKNAIEHYQNSLALSPNRTSVVIALAQTLVRENRASEAAVTYATAIEAMPENMRLKLLAASLSESIGDYKQAKTLYESISMTSPDAALAGNNLAMLLVTRFPNEENFQRALKLAKPFENATESVLVDTLAWVYYKLGDYDKALPLLQRIVDANGKVNIFRYHLGMTHFQRNELDAAKKELTLALSDGDLFPEAEIARKTLNTL
jgi:tetratricopeptide (TPR) repeat protein